MKRPPDITINFPESTVEDPDRRAALKVTNFLADVPITQALAIYSLAFTMSFREMEKQQQQVLLSALGVACMRSWDRARTSTEPQAPPCPVCTGAGTIGSELVSMEICDECGGTGGMRS